MPGGTVGKPRRGNLQNRFVGFRRISRRPGTATLAAELP